MTELDRPIRHPWKAIEPLGEGDFLRNGALGAVDALRDEWERRLKVLPESTRTIIRQRSLRRLAVETGILERLYDVEWGLTLTLVAEGFAREVVERAGGVLDDRTLATLRAQMDSLSMVLDFVRSDRALTPSFVKELHQAIVRTQDTYVVTDSLGRVVETALPKGEWKTQPNSVTRSDGSLLEYAPPEHVAAEMDRLILLWSDLEKSDTHPLARAAWLHHRFVQIHPFADGNGRVARALTLLVLEKHHYAPLVVDRWHRADYLKALDAANDGSLVELVRLFAKLESTALTGELEEPEPVPGEGMAIEVAHTLAAQLAEHRRRKESEIRKRIQVRALAVGGRMKAWFDTKKDEIAVLFRSKGLQDLQLAVDVELPPTPRHYWFRRQIIDSARTAGHYADFSTSPGWCSLRIRYEGLQLRYVASLHGAGREPGVMAVTTFGEVEIHDPCGETPDGLASREYLRTTKDAFRFVHTEDNLDVRASELEDLLDEGLAAALAQFLGRL